MKTWRVQLNCGDQGLGEVKINRGIFQGDSLSPLLFVACLIPLSYVLRKSEAGYTFGNGEKINHLLFMDDLKLYAKNEKALDSLVQTVRIFSTDIGMEFGLDKCAVLTMKRGKIVKSQGIEMPDEETIKGMEEGDTYKYHGILEADRIKSQDMKEKIKKEYLRRTRKVLESKLNSGNLIRAINTWAVSLVRYSAAFIGWTHTELEGLDRKTRKLMTMHGALHPRSDIDRLYLPRSEGGRGLIGIEDTVTVAIAALEEYVRESEERLLVAASMVDGDIREAVSAKQLKKDFRKTKADNWRKKKLHGNWVTRTDSKDLERWNWLKDGTLKRRTEALICAAQEQSLRTNMVKAKIDKTQTDSKCRICKQADETVSHILSECRNLAQREYKKRHDMVGKRIHWEICRKYKVKVKEKWYEHEPEAVVETEKCKILWDFMVQTDARIPARRPDVIVINKENKQCQIIDFAVPFDTRIRDKEAEKVLKYQDLAREVSKLWKVKAQVIPVVIGALGSMPETLDDWLKKIGIETKKNEIQKSVILGSAQILRKVLEA